MKLAGIIGILFTLLGIGLFIYSLINLNENNFSFDFSFQGTTPVSEPSQISTGQVVLIIFSLILFVISLLFFYYGFFKMGWHTDKLLLKFSSLVLMGFIILFVISSLMLYGYTQSLVKNNFSMTGNVIESGFTIPTEISEGLGEFIRGIIPWQGYLFLFILNVLIIFMILFYIGLMMVGKEVKFAIISGILGTIVTSILFVLNLIFTYIILFDIMILVGWILRGIPNFNLLLLLNYFIEFLIILTLLFMSLSLFSASKKFESGIKEQMQTQIKQQTTGSVEERRSKWWLWIILALVLISLLILLIF